MNDFPSLFKKYDPMTASMPVITEDYAKGVKDERKRILDAINTLNVDSFEDICYKTDIITLIGPVNE